MIDYEDALQLVLAAARPLPAEACDVRDAIGRVLAAPVVSNEALPPFDNSAMDGFALSAAGARVAAGAEFDVAGGSAAGDGASQVATGAWEIMTGARVPDGLDAIVPVENVAILASDAAGRPLRIRLLSDVAPGQHVRRRGEDVAKGDAVADPGRVFDASLRMLCSAIGVAEVQVRRRPRVALINTGRELVDDPRQALGAGEIRNSNGPFLAERLVGAGAEVGGLATVGDDVDDFLRAIAAMPQVDVIVSTGAVSMGRFDFVPEALARLGATTLFHKARVRPGKPILTAVLPSGSLFFGLPGNPASTAVGLRFFVEPVLRRMLGMSDESRVQLPLRAGYGKRVPLRMHLKASVGVDGHGRVSVDVLGGQESFRIRPLLDANAWAIIPADVDALAAGELVEVVSRGHLDPLSVQT